MKKSIVVIAFAAVTVSIVACNNGSNSNSANSIQDTAVQTTAQSSGTTTTPAKAGVDPGVAMSVKEIVDDYLQLKNALTRDNGSDAAAAGKSLVSAFDKVDNTLLTEEQKQSYTDISDDAKEMAKHISENPDKLDHQREHFDMLSQDMYDLVKIFGAGRPLYQAYCPMYNDKKGAAWLSETKEIKNPYLGTEMLTCGSIKEDLN